MQPLRLTRAQLNEIDRRCPAAGVSIYQLMENAGRAVFEEATKMLHRGDAVTVVCGRGNNGGDGFVAARLLHQRGYLVQVLFEDSEGKWSDATMANAQKVHRDRIQCSGLNVGIVSETTPTLFIDALRGTGLTSAPRKETADIINAMNRSGRPILAVDIPSGLDCDTGAAPGACVRAQRTVTFVGDKVGFANPKAFDYTGEVVVADIGVPKAVMDGVLAETR